jgi:hypothetical protein
MKLTKRGHVVCGRLAALTPDEQLQLMAARVVTPAISWFDISPADSLAGPSWVVESRLVVFCSDAPEPRGEAKHA